MNRGAIWLAVLTMAASVHAEDRVVTVADYQATLKAYEELKPLAKKVLTLSRLLALKAETIPEETDPVYMGKSTRALQESFEKLILDAAPLGDTSFVEPFGRCGVLPKMAQNYATSLLTNDHSSQTYDNLYQQTYRDCKAAINNKPIDKTGLAILDLGDN
ncbi:hypothetical protein [Aeromonas jandaei]|uniref:hypothetical protein n=1 Tax=Aeromonas jandaei TaxID=650 RepID=UPI0010570769|nr:hypothetical protein [Aeromonas jandaei]